MKAETLFPAQRELHRAAGDFGEERSLGLNAHVFFTAKRAAICDQSDEDFSFGHRQKRRDLPPVIKHTLALRVNSQSVALRYRDARLGLEIHMLDELGLKCVGSDVSRIL